MERGERGVESLLEEGLDWRWKSFPASSGSITVGDLRDQKWNVLRGDLLFPVMLLKESALRHNLDTMARFCRETGVSLAPHGKTTMAPQLVQRQFDAGAWAICAATVSQARVLRAFGAPRVMIANEVVDPAATRWIAREQDSRANPDIYCLVDSVVGVSIVADALAQVRPRRSLPVLIELGIQGGRAGCRTPDQVEEVAEGVAASPFLRLAGVEGYEGIIDSGDLDATLRAVDEYVEAIRTIAESLAARGSFRGSDEVVVTAGGSTYFDRVVEGLTRPWEMSLPVRVVLRSGCYLTHDHGHYERLSPFGSRSKGGPRLQPALEVWGAVLSRPEPELAIIGFGKRDVPYDIDMPIAQTVQKRNGAQQSAGGALTVVALNDQHAYVRVEPGQDLEVGDVVGCGISHPCTAFDKWSLIPVVDDDYRVIDAIRTFF